MTGVPGGGSGRSTALNASGTLVPDSTDRMAEAILSSGAVTTRPSGSVTVRAGSPGAAAGALAGAASWGVGGAAVRVGVARGRGRGLAVFVVLVVLQRVGRVARGRLPIGGRVGRFVVEVVLRSAVGVGGWRVGKAAAGQGAELSQ